MRKSRRSWDYLIVTASNQKQARAYESQLRLREQLGFLADVGRALVVADPEGKRIGSGGSSVQCVLEVLNRERSALAGEERSSAEVWRRTLERLSVLIIHAGGDSRRLPAYAPCGKVFVPVPGESDHALTTTLFDRQLPTYLALPPNSTPGQVVIASGDVLLSFDPATVSFQSGITGLGCYADQQEAARHGVYCPGPAGTVRRYLQKPRVEEQAAKGAVDRYGRSVLDIGVLSLDAEAATKLLVLAQVGAGPSGELRWSDFWHDALLASGLDFYREICCALGAERDFCQYQEEARSSGSRLDSALLRLLFDGLSDTRFHVQILTRCGFLHFGTSLEVIQSGAELARRDRGVSQLNTCLSVNNQLGERGALMGADAWLESCRISAPVRAGGQNLVTGIDVNEPLELGPGDCLDVVQGKDGQRQPVWFIRCYGVSDTFKETLSAGARFCGRPLEEWIREVSAEPKDVWPRDLPVGERSAWNAALFPAEQSPDAYRNWLWMLHPEKASGEQKEKWRKARRYSPAEIAARTDFEAFYRRRSRLRFEEILQSLPAMFRTESDFSAPELALILAETERPAAWVAAILDEARWRHASSPDPGADSFTFSRLMHTLSSAVLRRAQSSNQLARDVVPNLADELAPANRDWLTSLSLMPGPGTTAGAWTDALRHAAFSHLERAIISSGAERRSAPRNALRPDEIVWGRAPARLDLGGGWTDTPPYSLENGGSVINAAVNLNGQPPIQCYGRVIEEPVIRIGSIDLGARVEIRDLNALLDYRLPTSEFALAKAALAMSGLDPAEADWRGAASLEQMLKDFGGGIELTTLAAIPKGSGLGTSSIMGAVVLSVINRVIGRQLSRRELFHGVLRLEQALTTGGGWQDQVGGAIDGVKLIDADAGLVPDIRVHYFPPDVLDPRTNGGSTLLYYTGITRLAKNILRDVVGRYLDRDREALATLRQLHGLGARIGDALARKDLASFGRLIDVAWRLNKRLDPHSTNEQIEALLSRLAPHLHGAKLLGAGGGGFLLMVAKSAPDADQIRAALQHDPPNQRARFFDFDVSAQGLVVSVC